MELYTKFNKYVYDRFFSPEYIGDRIVMNIDEQFIEQACKIIDCNKKQLLNYIKHKFSRSWNYALSSFGDQIPNYLGLIAIQIYVAYSMQKDKTYSSRKYNPRIAALFDIDPDTDLQKLYKEYQETIWERLKYWATEQGFDLNIPHPKTHTGRYVQYPKSQALLNKEDLERFSAYFCFLGLRAYEEISYKDFRSLIFYKSSSSFKFTTHYRKLHEQLSLDNDEERIYEQVFAHYQRWDGQTKDKDYLSKYKKAETKKYHNNYNLVLNTNLDEISLLDNFDNKLTSILIDELTNLHGYLKTLEYNSIHLKEHFVLFAKDQNYGDWCECRFIYPKNEYIFLVEKNKCNKEIHSFLSHKGEQLKTINNYTLHKIVVNDAYELPESILKLFSNAYNPVKLVNGLKLSRNVWMEGAEPSIIFEKKVTCWVNGVKIECNEDSSQQIPLNLPARIEPYVLKVHGFSPVRFYIHEPKYNINLCKKGWNFSKKEAQWQSNLSESIISGLSVDHIQLKNEGENSIHAWISANLKNGSRIQDKETPTIINAIKRSQYGIIK